MLTPLAQRPRSRDEFEIAIICALQIESDAVEAVLDHDWEDEGPSYGKAIGDQNSYMLGSIAGHNAVICYTASMGKVAAATAAASFRNSFPNIRLGLVVGVCAGVPNPERSPPEPIFLGDVIISTGVVQYDFGRQFADRLVPKDTLMDSLGRPNAEIRAFLRQLQGLSKRRKLRKMCNSISEAICEQEDFHGWSRPSSDEDKLYQSDYRHKHRDSPICVECPRCISATDPVCQVAVESSCSKLKCEDAGLEPWYKRRNVPANTDPQAHSKQIGSNIHFGLMASGDSVIKSSFHRDRLAEEEDVLGFEMEGAGVWDNFPTIIVKAVCDYGDSHKDKRWQRYAAVAAASCAKALLQNWRSIDRSSNTAASAAGTANEAMPSNREAPTSTFTFNNHGSVGVQGANQTFNRPIFNSGIVSQAPNYGSQVGYNAGTVNNNTYGPNTGS